MASRWIVLGCLALAVLFVPEFLGIPLPRGPLLGIVAVTTALYNSIFVGVVSGLLPELPAAKIGSVFDFRSDPRSKESSDITISISLDAKGILIQVSNARNANVQKYPIPWEQYYGSPAGAETEKAVSEDPAAPAEPKADKDSSAQKGDK